MGNTKIDPKQKKSILIVDDQYDIREILARHLSRFGFIVLQAKSVDTALDLIQNNNIDAMFLDIVMPEKDRFQLLSKTKKEDSSFKAIVMAGGGKDMSPEFIDHYASVLKADYVLFKPFSEDDLKKTLSELSLAN